MGVLQRQFRSICEFVWPSYRPECHYMRGPGPACRKRTAVASDPR